MMDGSFLTVLIMDDLCWFYAYSEKISSEENELYGPINDFNY